VEGKVIRSVGAVESTSPTRRDVRAADLVVLSHLRWTWVWQRPQHLVSRLARGRRTFFVEEPLAADVDVPTLRTEPAGPVTRVWLEVPQGALALGAKEHVDFGHPQAESYAAELGRLLGGKGPRTVWVYTPMALELAEELDPDILVYDVMDDLASFAEAPEGLEHQAKRLLDQADVVFTGGRSLHHATAASRPEGTFLFPSGVEPEHYAIGRATRRRQERPAAGYVGVLDERLDLGLLAGLAAELPDWDVVLVGPVAKIDPVDLPQAANLLYAGSKPYAELPEAMGRFDVGLMPFALNDATRSISPTKTLEYLAAGLPVVSTRVPDVVADYTGVVAFADDPAGFASACRTARREDPEVREHRVRPILARQTWDAIAARMSGLVEEAAENRLFGGAA